MEILDLIRFSSIHHQHRHHYHRSGTILSSTLIPTKFSKVLICIFGVLLYAVDHIVECRHHESIENIAATSSAAVIQAQPLVGPKHNSQSSSSDDGNLSLPFLKLYFANNNNRFCFCTMRARRCLFHTLSRTRRSGPNFRC